MLMSAIQRSLIEVDSRTLLTKPEIIYFNESRLLQKAQLARGYSSVGRAMRSQCIGQGFEFPYLHINDRKPNSLISSKSIYLEVNGEYEATVP